MRPHTWIVEEHDGGHLGAYDMWRCTTCNALGGLCWFGQTEPHQAYRPAAPRAYAKSLTLPLDDCDAAQALMIATPLDP